jgi:chemotaxis protein histidine kinase CheA
MLMTSVEQQLDSLRSQFSEHAERRIKEMRRLLTGLQDDRSNVDALRQLRGHFHSFAGLGTTYGHPKASELGDRGESRVSDVLQESGTPGNEDLAAWRRLVDALEADLAR